MPMTLNLMALAYWARRLSAGKGSSLMGTRRLVHPIKPSRPGNFRGI